MPLLLLLLAQSAADDPRDAFREWQARILEERATPRPELRRVLAHRIHVPAPDPGKPDLTPVRLDFGSMDPLGLLPLAPVVATRIGEPKTRVRSEAKAAVFDLFALEIKNLHYMSADDGAAAFGLSEALAGPDVGLGGGLRFKSLIGIASNGTRARDGGKLGVEYSGHVVGGEFHVDGRGMVEAAGKVGPKVRLYEGALEVAAQVTVEVAAPVVVDDIQWKSRWGLSQVASGAAERISDYVAGVQPCAYCAARGTVTCRQCADRKTIACPTCARNGAVPCGDCNGHGYLTCPTEKACGRCGGSGQGRCSGCGGSGSRTEYEQVVEMETRTVKEMVHVGFDSERRPVYEMRTYTEEVPVTRSVSRSVPCDSCGGSGSGDACRNCGGGGVVTCLRCSGTGRFGCSDCGGKGTLRCRTCKGELDLTCPTCAAKGFSCPLCGGRGKVGR